MKHTIQAHVENKFGVLARISALFSARGYNIESLAVGVTHDQSISCITMVVDAPDERILEQIKKQLNKLIDVITVVDFTHKEYLDRELILLKVEKQSGTRKLIDSLEKKCSLRIIDETDGHCILEMCVDRVNVDEVLSALNELKIVDLVRTGKIAISK